MKIQMHLFCLIGALATGITDGRISSSSSSSSSSSQPGVGGSAVDMTPNRRDLQPALVDSKPHYCTVTEVGSQRGVVNWQGIDQCHKCEGGQLYWPCGTGNLCQGFCTPKDVCDERIRAATEIKKESVVEGAVAPPSTITTAAELVDLLVTETRKAISSTRRLLGRNLEDDDCSVTAVASITSCSDKFAATETIVGDCYTFIIVISGVEDGTSCDVNTAAETIVAELDSGILSLVIGATAEVVTTFVESSSDCTAITAEKDKENNNLKARVDALLEEIAGLKTTAICYNPDGGGWCINASFEEDEEAATEPANSSTIEQFEPSFQCRNCGQDCRSAYAAAGPNGVTGVPGVPGPGRSQCNDNEFDNYPNYCTYLACLSGQCFSAVPNRRYADSSNADDRDFYATQEDTVNLPTSVISLPSVIIDLPDPVF